MNLRIYIAIIVVTNIIFSCQKTKLDYEANADSQGHTQPTIITKKTNKDVSAILPFENKQDFEDANKGFIAKEPNLIIKNGKGEIIWNQPAYSFLEEKEFSSINPSLQRQAKLNNIHGLFKVTDKIYQIRGYDLANMTLIEGDTGWIIIDPLTSKETANAAITFARKHLKSKPIKAIIFTHSHVDHFGGVLGIVSEKEIIENNIRVIAPKGFIEEATSENVIAGIAMGRRSMYMFGKRLDRSERGHVGSGLGKSPAYGTIGIVEPNEIIAKEKEEKIIDGVKFIFQNASGSEAPAEFTFFIPKLNAFCGAEVVSHTQHNLYTLRGTKVRDALKWSNYIDKVINELDSVDTYFGSHHWPVWGNSQIFEFLTKQRDLYKYIHDQTVRLFNEGYTPIEIENKIELPNSLNSYFANRGYYGTLKHNSRAVYQFYLGWYDGNPVHLNPLTPDESAVRYIQMMGGSEIVIQKAQTYFDKGDYRWTSEILNHLTFAEPDNVKAKSLLAKTYDQLGYQSESGPWRDNYLTAAYELRHGAPEKGMDISILEDVMKNTSVPLFFDSMAVRLNGPKAEGKNISVKIIFTDLEESYFLKIENSVLHHRKITQNMKSDVTLKMTHSLFIKMLIGQAGIKDTLFSEDLEIEGDKIDLLKFFNLFDKPTGTFSIVAN